MFSKTNNLLIRDKSSVAKLPKILQSRAKISNFFFPQLKFLLNCLAIQYIVYKIPLHLQLFGLCDLSLIKRLRFKHEKNECFALISKRD